MESNTLKYGQIVKRDFPVNAVRGVTGKEVIGTLLIDGRRMPVFFPTRRIVEPGDTFNWDIQWVGRYLKALAPNRDEQACEAPIRKPCFWKVTNMDDFEEAPVVDAQGRKRYYFKPTGMLSYLAADLEGHLPVVSEKRPVYVVATKFPYCFIVGSEEIIDLVEYFEAEEGDRLPDLTLIMLGRLKVYDLRHESLRVVGREIKRGNENAWTPFVDKTVEELLGVKDESGQFRTRWVANNLDEIDVYYQAALKPYERYTPEYLDQITDNPCSPGQIRLIRQAAEHDPKELRQAKMLLEMRFKRHQTAIAASKKTAAANATAMLQTMRSGQPAAAPPAKALAAQEGRALPKRTVDSYISEWAKLVESACPIYAGLTIDDMTLAEWGRVLYSSASSFMMDEILQFDADPNVAIQVFNGSGFPIELRWPVYKAIRVLQGIDPEKIPDAHRVALEAADISQEDLDAITAPEVARAKIIPYLTLMTDNAIDDRRVREKVSAGLAFNIGDLNEARALPTDEVMAKIAFTYESLELQLRESTKAKFKKAFATG